MRIEWSADAVADLDRFSEFLRATYPALAGRVAREIIANAQMLAQHPRSGHPIRGSEHYRQIVLQVLNTQYVFQYRERLVILRVFHGREARE